MTTRIKFGFDRPLVVGTRGSALARWQAEFVITALRKIAPNAAIELRVIATAGDRDPTRPLAEFGARGVFTTDLENALRSRAIDFAVHSLKDLPVEPVPDLPLAAILERADARDVLVSRHGVGLLQLPAGARLGTSSTRRTAQLLARRPDLTIVPLRGNIDTRLKKAMQDEYDAIVLAAAGVLRLGRGEAITEYFSVTEMLPEPGQGALAVQVRGEDDSIHAFVAQLDHASTRTAVTAERAFLRAFGGGCRTPMAAYAEQDGDALLVRGMLASPDGTHIVRAELRGNAEPAALGAALAAKILENGGAAIVGQPTRASSRPVLYGKRIVITRAASQAGELAEKIRAHGGEPVFFATIAFAPLGDFSELDAFLAQLEVFDWVVFTSANGVRAVMERLNALGLSDAAFQNTRVAAVGTGTAEALAEHNLRADFAPTEFGGVHVARELPAEKRGRILLLRGDLAGEDLVQGLRERGSTVEAIDVYHTVMGSPARLAWETVDAVTFTSASTVNFCWELLDDTSRAALATRTIFCIGPVTAAAARALQLPVTATAAEHTLDGLVQSLLDHYERNFHAG